VLSLEIEVLSTITDNLDADLVEQLPLALVDRDERLRAMRTVLSISLEHSNALQLENTRLRRLRRRLTTRLDLGRR